MSTRELIAREVASLPEALQREVYDFAHFLRLKDADDRFNGRPAGHFSASRPTRLAPPAPPSEGVVR